jgi:hypothetical protein
MTYFFVVDDERHGYLGIVGPFQSPKTPLAVSFKVAWERVVLRCSVNLRHNVGISENDQGSLNARYSYVDQRILVGLQTFHDMNDHL